MTALVWDQDLERTFHSGVDRGVLFLQDGAVVPWNGLTSFEDTTTADVVSSYIDGVKYLEYSSPGDFSGKLHAFTYPPEFDKAIGIRQPYAGLRVHDQVARAFCLSYRTRVGNCISGVDYAYIVHLLYNVMANPDNTQLETLGDVITPEEFSWTLTAKPIRSSAHWRPTAHISLDSREMDPDSLQSIEYILYGTESDDPHFPTLDELLGIFGGSLP